MTLWCHANENKLASFFYGAKKKYCADVADRVGGRYKPATVLETLRDSIAATHSITYLNRTTVYARKPSLVSAYARQTKGLRLIEPGEWNGRLNDTLYIATPTPTSREKMSPSFFLNQNILSSSNI